MRLGALLGPVTDAARAGFLAEQARMYAGEGYASLWSAHSVGRGFMLSDPFLAMTVAATATEGVEIGSAIVPIPLYHSVDLAHRVVSLHQICGDRLILGIGAGSTEDDFKTYGRDYAARFKTFHETAATLRETYAKGSEANRRLSPWPGLARAPRLFYGTWGKGVERAAADYDGWIASGHYRGLDELIPAIERYRAAGGQRAVVSTILLDKDTDLGALKDRFAGYAEAGFDDAVVMIQPGGPDAAAVRKLVGP